MMMRTRQQMLFGSMYIFLGMALSACGGGSGDGASTRPAVAVDTGNVVPTILGAPATRVSVGILYSYTPTASDSNLDSLSFSVVNQPTWASFDTTTGALSGTPGIDDVGTTSGISIVVSDGELSAALAAFDLTVFIANSGISNTQPDTYTWSVLQDGETAFIDRDFVFGDIPARYEGLEFLRTSNDDMFLSTPDAISFDVAVPVTVYVSYDSRISMLPAWLESWTNTGDSWSGRQLQTSVYSKDFPAGTIVLGGNESGYNMYNVAIESAGYVRPAIGKSPATSIMQGEVYQFIALTPGSLQLEATFAIENKPRWAQFDTKYGALWGKPGAADVGVYDDIVISVSDGQTTTTLHTFSIAVESGSNLPPPSGTSNNAPTIGGTPATSVSHGGAYQFVPSANDANGDTLIFAINNKPNWAQFNTEYGALWGKPGVADIGVYKNIVIEVSDGNKTVSLPAFSITVASSSNPPPLAPPPSGNANKAPWIGGTPATTVSQGDVYNFVPNAGDSNRDTLTFTIQNKPAWASFSKSKGGLSGTPGVADVGVYENIVIRVSDGQSTTALPAFRIVVAGVSTGSASLSWQAPTQNADGSPLMDLSGYKIYYGNSPSSYTRSVNLNNPGITAYVVSNLSGGIWYFAVTAHDSSGNESVKSGTVSKIISTP